MARRKPRAVKPAAATPVAPQKPATVTVARLFAFYGDDGLLRQWQEGEVVTDPVQIAWLLERQAPLEVPTCQQGS